MDSSPPWHGPCAPSPAFLEIEDEDGANEENEDSLLAHAGYSIRSSELLSVAQRLEYLDSIMTASPDDTYLSCLSSESIQCDPSDLASWIECMIGELAPKDYSSSSPPPAPSLPLPHPDLTTSVDSSVTPFTVETTTVTSSLSSSSSPSLSTSPPPLPLPLPPMATEATASDNSYCYTATAVAPVPETVYHPRPPEPELEPGDPGEGCQELGIQLVCSLLACAQAIHEHQPLHTARALVARTQQLLIGLPPVQKAGAMAKVATHFTAALARRLSGDTLAPPLEITGADPISELLHAHFYEACPYLKFAHFTANQAILEAMRGHERVHVIDLDLAQGLQWPALIQALALRPGGPPSMRLTGIGPPHVDGRDALQETGRKLAKLAQFVHVEFEFRGVVATKLADIHPWLLKVRPGEAVAVNSIFRLHRLLHHNEEVESQAHTQALYNNTTTTACTRVNPVEHVLEWVRGLNPRVVTLVEQEANHNSPIFYDRFMQALYHYSTIFDSLEASPLSSNESQRELAEEYLGREISNIVACEGASRVERHETLTQWRLRMTKAGFWPLPMGPNALKQVSMLLTHFSVDGYTVQDNNGCLTLGWHTRPLIAASAWHSNRLLT